VAKSLASWTWKLGVTFALLFIIFRYVPFGAVVREMSGAIGGWIAAGFALSFVERLVASWRVKLLTDRLDMRLSIWKIFEINVVSIFYSTFLPGDLAGGAVRWYRMARPGGHRAEAFAAIVFERLIDTIALVFFGILFWFWNAPPFGSQALDGVLLALLALLIGGTAFALSPAASTLVRRMGSLIPWRKAQDVFLEKSEKVLVSVRMFRRLSPGGMILLAALTALRHMLSVLMLLCFALALGLALDFSAIGWIRSFVNILTMIPISFAGLGVREGSLVVLLQPYGVAGSLAVALSLFMFSVHLAFAVAGGLVEVFRMFRPDPTDKRLDRLPE
jgi:glycosyltransferase 2 family protein